MRAICNFKDQGFLKRLGVYGFEPLEKIILAALITMDPLLLIGKSGTGKTFLLNSISEALGLVHRHYNASLISFDDLVGFPYPDENKTSIRYMETPATVWGAESVLVDEISRCKPEHQNRLFSLVYERRIQGIPLEILRYRWAAMNPCGMDGDSDGDYLGSEPLDQALADRFGLIVQVADWQDLNKEDQLLVANPAGDGELSDDAGVLKGWLESTQKRFFQLVEECRPVIKAAVKGETPHNGIPIRHQCMLEYVIAAMKGLLNAGIRVSPRRARMISRSLIAGYILDGEQAKQETYRQILECSIPFAAWGASVDQNKIHAVHRLAWDAAFDKGDKAWIHKFHLETDPAKQIEMLFRNAPSKDAASMAVCEMLASQKHGDKPAIMALALYPAAAMGKTPIGSDAVNELGRIAQEILEVDGTVTWQVPNTASPAHHPEYTRYGKVIADLKGARQERAQQFFFWSIIKGIVYKDPVKVEQVLNECIKTVKREAKL
ncbi:MAG: hypothetical protein CVU71_07235 [Deltaproteobacteria bacterium HGW-Deltaproteobacteria-6]|jgi:MoxR-like ATPase|nr:MAG: hypothetical protein CVU71_07235 [Deltaproteobacteria bacterium HGW-Deltaproteobacteria-6]